MYYALAFCAGMIFLGHVWAGWEIYHSTRKSNGHIIYRKGRPPERVL